jgi:hypothetical protein
MQEHACTSAFSITFYFFSSGPTLAAVAGHPAEDLASAVRQDRGPGLAADLVVADRAVQDWARRRASFCAVSSSAFSSASSWTVAPVCHGGTADNAGPTVEFPIGSDFSPQIFGSTPRLAMNPREGIP